MIANPQPEDVGVYQCVGMADKDETAIVSTSYLNIQCQ